MVEFHFNTTNLILQLNGKKIFNDNRTDAIPTSTLKRLRCICRKQFFDFTYLSFGKGIEVKLPLLMLKHENRSYRNNNTIIVLRRVSAYFLISISVVFDVCRNSSRHNALSHRRKFSCCIHSFCIWRK